MAASLNPLGLAARGSLGCVHRPDLSQVADRLFGAFEELDDDTIRDVCHPDSRFWSSASGREVILDQLIEYLPVLHESLGAHRYEDVRRMVATDGFVEQHAVRSTRPTGEALDVEVCVVARTDGTGKIVRLDEYVATPTSL